MQKYRIPKNLCQSCYLVSGRFIMDCYCIVCEECFESCNIRGGVCSLCGKQRKGHKIDAKNEEGIKKVSHLFENVDSGLTRLLEISKFQTEIANRYCHHLEKKLAAYQSAVQQLITFNPSLSSYFSTKVHLKKMSQTQRNQSAILSSKANSTIKPMKQYNSELYESKRTTTEIRGNMGGIRQIGATKQNLSGNAVYKVPNINFNTAIRSSKRPNYCRKVAPNYQEENQHMRRRR